MLFFFSRLQELEENVSLSSSKRKQLYDSRKSELHTEQKKIEDEHLQILKTQAEHDMVDFRQKVLHEKQNLEKQLLQEVRNDTHSISEVLARLVLLVLMVCFEIES